MRNLLLAMMTVLVVCLAAALSFLLQEPATSTFEIDRDRAAVTSDIAAAEAESAEYTGGVIKILVDLRIAMLRDTFAMLDQKRISLVRRISLNYVVDGHSLKEASNSELEDILREIEQAERTVDLAKQEAARYTGGLLQSMALLKAGTDELSVSQLRLKFYSAKYGIALPLPSPDANKSLRKDFEASKRSKEKGSL